MAALQCAATNTYSLRHYHCRFSIDTPYPRKSILVVCRFHTSLPSKPTKRKNYLRKKLLKTLQKPLVPKLPPSSPIIPIEFSPIQEKETRIIHEIENFDKSISSEPTNEEVQFCDEATEIESLLPAGLSADKNVDILAKSPFLKYGLWLVGAIVFQAVCAAWVFGSADFDNKSEMLNRDKKSSVLEVGENGDYGVDSVSYVNELEMKRKIQEIRVMAREAREKERLESKNSDFDSEEDDEIDGRAYVKSGIEEEVNDGLIKLKKKLENAHDKMPMASVGYSRKGDLDEREGNVALLFRKKHKFKGLSADPREKPRGFISSDDRSINKSKESGSLEKGDKKSENSNDVINLRDEEKPAEQFNIDARGNDAVLVVAEVQMNTNKKVTGERGIRKQGRDKMVSNPKEKIDGKSVIAAVKYGELTAEVVKSNELSNANGSLKGNGVDNAKSVKKGERETDFWWLNLPYVLGILMQRGNNGEGGEGLYTLKSNSSSDGQVSHVVAFEDRVDATNFCYLLQSFFDDLEDFNADIVPLIVKELKEAVKLRTMNVTVVKKGQLRLYAGQPLVDAEMALRAMVRQQGVSE